MANDLTELQLKEYEDALIDQEKQDEIEFHRWVNGMKAKYDKRNSLLGKYDANSGAGDEESPIVFDFNKEDEELVLPSRANRLFYLNFQQGALLTGRGITNSSTPRAKTLSPRSLFTRIFSGRTTYIKAGSSVVSSPVQSVAGGTTHNDDIYVNRHLKSRITQKRPLTESDSELLRCIGLDTFVMIRFLRFCFDATFHPFLLSVMILVPTYYTINGMVLSLQRI